MRVAAEEMQPVWHPDPYPYHRVGSDRRDLRMTFEHAESRTFP